MSEIDPAPFEELPARLRRFVRRNTRYIRNPRHLGWAIENRWKGYKFGPIQRCRTCDHTTPYHYEWCERGAA